MHTVVFSGIRGKEHAKVANRISKKEETANSTTNLLSQAFKVLRDREGRK